MFSKQLTMRLSASRKFISDSFSRNIGSTAIFLNKLDPVQQLFVDKSREYYKKRR
jgi:hypothetical protein